MKTEGHNPVGVGFAGLLVGGLLIWLAIGYSSPQESPMSGVSIDDLALAIEELGSQVRLLSDAGTDGPSASPSPVRQVSEPVPISPEMLDRLDKLDFAMAKLLESYASMANARLSSPVTSPPLEDLNRPVDTVALEGLVLNEEIDNDLQHMNWSYQEVLNAYGKPSRSNPSPGGVGHKWYYELPNGGEVIFWFVDGQVGSAFVTN